MAMRIAPPSTVIGFPKKRPAKQKGYIAWLHTLPSCVSGVMGVEAAHTSFSSPWYGHYGRGRGTKAPDIFALPLTMMEHQESHKGNEAEWWNKQGVNPHELCLTLWAIYSMYDEHEATQRATARILQGLPK